MIKKYYHSIKGILKEIYWFFYSFFYKKGILPKSINSILFVCKGNIIRSIFAEKMMHKMIMTMENIESAGVEAKPGSSSPANAIEIAKNYNIDLKQNKSKQLKLEMIKKNDIIICMEVWHKKRIIAKYPEYKNKIFLMAHTLNTNSKQYYLAHNIPDPYGKTKKEFVECFNKIEESI